MAIEVKLPDLGEGISSASVVDILVKVGDVVTKDQDIVELETDKATTPVPSSVAGTVQKILISVGDDVKVGQVMFVLDGVDAKTAPAPAKPETPAKHKQTAPAAQSGKPAAITQSTPAKTSTAATAPAPVRTNIPAAPSVRRFAREIGIDIGTIPGSGPGGRISKDDIKAFAKKLNESRTSGSVGGNIAIKPLPDFSSWGEIKTEKMSKIRQVTADHMTYCWQTIPHVTQFANADITELDKLRKKFSTKERKLTVTPFLLKVIAAALKQFPQFNSSIDMTTYEIVYKNYFNIGVAVDTPNGLLVPVLRDVQNKSIYEITDELNEIAERARNRRIKPDELKGGCFTLTNLGGIGGTAFTPIINSPEVAILGVSRGGLTQVHKDGQFVNRLLLPLSLSYDHRIIDGADAARFIMWICDAIEQPFMMDL